MRSILGPSSSRCSSKVSNSDSVQRDTLRGAGKINFTSGSCFIVFQYRVLPLALIAFKLRRGRTTPRARNLSIVDNSMNSDNCYRPPPTTNARDQLVASVAMVQSYTVYDEDEDGGVEGEDLVNTVDELEKRQVTTLTFEPVAQAVVGRVVKPPGHKEANSRKAALDAWEQAIKQARDLELDCGSTFCEGSLPAYDALFRDSVATRGRVLDDTVIRASDVSLARRRVDQAHELKRIKDPRNWAEDHVNAGVGSLLDHTNVPMPPALDNLGPNAQKRIREAGCQGKNYTNGDVRSATVCADVAVSFKVRNHDVHARLLENDSRIDAMCKEAASGTEAVALADQVVQDLQAHLAAAIAAHRQATDNQAALNADVESARADQKRLWNFSNRLDPLRLACSQHEIFNYIEPWKRGKRNDYMSSMGLAADSTAASVCMEKVLDGCLATSRGNMLARVWGISEMTRNVSSKYLREAGEAAIGEAEARVSADCHATLMHRAGTSE